MNTLSLTELFPGVKWDENGEGEYCGKKIKATPETLDRVLTQARRQYDPRLLKKIKDKEEDITAVFVLEAGTKFDGDIEDDLLWESYQGFAVLGDYKLMQYILNSGMVEVCTIG